MTPPIPEQLEQIARDLTWVANGGAGLSLSDGIHAAVKKIRAVSAALADAKREAKRELLADIRADFDARCAAENHIIVPGLAFASGLLKLRAKATCLPDATRPDKAKRIAEQPQHWCKACESWRFTETDCGRDACPYVRLDVPRG
jgi:hypothetical protein